MNEDKISILIKNPNKLKTLREKIFIFYADPWTRLIDFKKIFHIARTKIKLKIQ